jgi:hypothetical protein
MARTGILVTLALSSTLAAARPAAAQAVQLRGAPPGDRAAIVGTLEQARARMGVCWVRTPPATVQVALEVAASGEVTRATAKSKGPAAQCAAGILAVATLAPSGKAWKGTVELTTAAGGKGQDVQAIHDELATHGATFFACQQQGPGFAGRLTLRVTVERSGAISAATGEVAERTAGTGKEGAAVGRCVAAAARRLTLAPIRSASVAYELAISFQGGAAGGGAAGGGAAPDPALQPSKKGPLEPAAIAQVIGGRRAALAGCARGSKARGKLVVRLAIDRAGTPPATLKSSEIDDAKVERCLLGVFGALRFPAAAGPTVVFYPVRLDPDGLKTGT